MNPPTAHLYENWIRSQLQFDICVSEALNDIVHNRHNDPSYVGLPQDGILLFNVMSQFKNQYEQNLRNVIHADQWDVLCPSSGSTDSKQFDVTLNVPVIRYNIVNFPPPTDPQGWRANIVLNPLNKADFVLVARKLLNESKHGTISDMNIKSKYDSILAKIEALLVGLGYQNMKLFEYLKTGSIEPYFNQILKKLDQKISDTEKKVDASVINLKHSLIDMKNERGFSRATVYQCITKMADVGKLLELSSNTHDTVSKTHDVASKTYGVTSKTHDIVSMTHDITREDLEMNRNILDGVNQLTNVHQAADSGSMCEKQGYQMQRLQRDMSNVNIYLDPVDLALEDINSKDHEAVNVSHNQSSPSVEPWSNYSYSFDEMMRLIRSDDPNDHQTFLNEISKHQERLYERSDGTTYLHYCAVYDRPSVCDHLLRMDSSIIDVRGDCNRTALIFASMRSSTSCVRVLLHHDADINAVDICGNNALWYAAVHEEEEVERILREAMKSEPST